MHVDPSKSCDDLWLPINTLFCIGQRGRVRVPTDQNNSTEAAQKCGDNEEHSTFLIIVVAVSLCSDRQLIQYTTCPLLAFLDVCTHPPELDLGTGNSDAPLQPSSYPSASMETELPSELLDTSLESHQPARSSLIRLEPLTEAEASEETLFYMCELSPAGAEADSTQLDRV